jgi:leader peptidase (prepilin peptidase)/N-methyltransferase
MGLPGGAGAELTAGLLALAAGGLAGGLGRRLLGRLRRGTRVAAPGCELAIGLCWVVAVVRWSAGGQPWWWLPVPLALAWFGVLLAVTDLRHHRLPDALTLPAYPVLGALLVAASVLGGGHDLLLRAASGALLFGGMHAVAHLLAPGALGAGDVKLAGSIGAVLGAVSLLALPLAAVLAAALTGALGPAAVLAGRLARLAGRFAGPMAGRMAWSRQLPHGPGMLLAAWVITVAAGADPLVPP